MGVKISQLPAVAVPALTDIFPVVQAGVTYKETVQQLATLLTGAGDIVTYTPPSVAGQIAVFTNTTGNIAVGSGTVVNPGSIQAGLPGTAGCLIAYPSAVSEGHISLCATNNSSGDFSTEITNVSTIAQDQVISIPDCGSSSASFIVSKSKSNQTITNPISTTTPNNSALEVTLTNAAASASGHAYATSSIIQVTDVNGGVNVGAFGSAVSSGTITTAQTSFYGVGGFSSIANASNGFMSGIAGQLNASGTLSGSAIISGCYGSLVLDGANINGATVSIISGEWGTVAPTQTDMSKTHLLYLSNNVAAVPNSQIYLKGDASYFLELASVSTYYIGAGTGSGSAGNSTHCAAQKVLTIYVNGAACYIPVFTQNS